MRYMKPVEDMLRNLNTKVFGERHYGQSNARERDPDTTVIGNPEACWCGRPKGHSWPGQEDGHPHPRYPR